jgi:hypothetical protein
MMRRYFDGVLKCAVATMSVALIAAPLAAQTTSPPGKPSPTTKRSPPRTTADGHPDSQGIWDFGTLTPLERPAALGDQPVFSDEEAAAFERDENRRQNRDLIDLAKGGVQYPPGGVGPLFEYACHAGN